MKSRNASIHQSLIDRLILRFHVFFFVAAAFSATTFTFFSVSHAEESSSSYFGGGSSNADENNDAEEAAPKKKRKKRPAKSASKSAAKAPKQEVELDEGAEPPPKRIPTTPGLSFNRSRIQKDNKTSDLELDSESGAEASLDQAAEGADTAVTPDVERRMNEAEKLEGQKKWREAIAVLKPVTPSLTRQGLLTLARCHSALNETVDEVRVLDLSKNKYPKDYVSMTKLGQAYSKMKKSAEAVQTFYEAKELNPRYKPAYEALLAELQIQGDTYEARTLVQDMMKKFGKEPKYLSALCRLYTKDAFLDKAVETCEEATQKDAGVPENYVNLAISLRDKLEPDRALTMINQAAAKFTNNEAVLSMQGLIYSDKKDHSRAYAAYKRAATFAPKSVSAWVGYGKAAYDLHKYQESLEAFKKACKIDSHASRDFREVAGRLHKEKNEEWRYKFTDALSSCNP
jgi:tetratricopeptide (TPR) repeat protein